MTVIPLDTITVNRVTVVGEEGNGGMSTWSAQQDYLIYTHNGELNYSLWPALVYYEQDFGLIPEPYMVTSC